MVTGPESEEGNRDMADEKTDDDRALTRLLRPTFTIEIDRAQVARTVGRTGLFEAGTSLIVAGRVSSSHAFGSAIARISPLLPEEKLRTLGDIEGEVGDEPVVGALMDQDPDDPDHYEFVLSIPQADFSDIKRQVLERLSDAQSSTCLKVVAATPIDRWDSTKPMFLHGVTAESNVSGEISVEPPTVDLSKLEQPMRDMCRAVLKRLDEANAKVTRLTYTIWIVLGLSVLLATLL